MSNPDPKTVAVAVIPALDSRFVPVDELEPYARNARTHSPEQIAKLANAIETFGFTNPVLADEKGIVAGHGRVMAARRLYELGREIALPNGTAIPAGTVPVIDVTGWDDEKRRAYILADNRLAQEAGWDLELLRLELDELEGFDFDLDSIGFGEAAQRAIFAGVDDDEGLSENYSRKIQAPIYEPRLEAPPPVAELFDATKADELKAEIEAAELPGEVRAFLVAAADRHVVFDFANIAEFYAHADAATQRLMEKSALVIIDFDAAIENGFVKLAEGMMQQAELSKARNGEAAADEE